MMPDMGAIAAALTSFQTAKNIAQAMIGLRDTTAFQSKLIEFQSAILDAQNSVFAANDERAALIEKISELEKQMAIFMEWNTQKQRYKMYSLAQFGASIAYILKPDATESEPFHCICAICYDNGKRSILQFAHGVLGSSEQILVCPICKSEVHADRWPPTIK
jgi:hypothetical protein